MRTPAILLTALLLMAGVAAVPPASASCAEPDTLTIHGQECIDLVLGIVEHPPGSLLVYVVKCLIIQTLGGICPPP